MAAIEYLESTPVTTEATHTGDTNWTDISGASIAGGSFTGSKKYLIIVNALAGGSNANQVFGLQVVHGSTAFASSEYIYEPFVTTGTGYGSYFWWTVFTQPATPETIKVQHKTIVAGHTVHTDEIRIFAINLSDDLTEDADWYFTEDTSGPTAHTTSPVTRASLTFTPGSAGDDWWILGRAEIQVDDAALSYEVHLQEDGADARTQLTREGEDVLENIPATLSYVAEGLSAASHTYRIQTEDAASGTQHDYDTSAVFALNLNKFETHSVIQTAGTHSPTTTDWEQLATVTHTPATTGDQFVFGDALSDPGAGYGIEDRLQFDGTSDPTGWEAAGLAIIYWNAATDQWNMPVAVIRSIDTAGDAIDLDGITTTAAGTFSDRLIVAFSMELAAAGGVTLTGAVRVTVDTDATGTQINALSGTVDTAVVTAATGTQIQALTGTVAPAVTVTATLSQANSLTATVTPTVTVAGTPDQTHALAATVAPTVTTTATGTQTHKLTGTVAPSLTATCSGLSLILNLEATVAPTVTVAGTARQINAATATVAPSVTTTATLEQAQRLTAAVQVSTITVATATEVEQLTGAVSVTFAVTSQLTLIHGASGTVAPAVTVTAAAEQTHALTATVAPSVTVTGTLSNIGPGTIDLTAAATVTVAVAAKLGVSPHATITPTVAVAATLTQTQRLAATITAAVTTTGTATQLQRLTGTVAPTVTATADLDNIIKLAASIRAVVVAAATATQIQQLAGTTHITAATAATLAQLQRLAATLTVTLTLAASDLSATAATTQGFAALTHTLAGTGTATLTLVGTGTPTTTSVGHAQISHTG